MPFGCHKADTPSLSAEAEVEATMTAVAARVDVVDAGRANDSDSLSSQCDGPCPASWQLRAEA